MTSYHTDTTGATYWQPTPRETPADTMRRLVDQGSPHADFYRQVLAKIDAKDSQPRPAGVTAGRR